MTPPNLNPPLPAATLPTRRAGWRAYALAAAGAAAALLLRLALAPWLGELEERPVLLLFVLPVILSVLAGGAGPGLACTALVALGTAWFVILPTGSLAFARPEDFAQWLLLILAGLLVSLLGRGAGLAPADGPAPAGDARLVAVERKVRGGFGLALACLGLVGVVSYLGVTRAREDDALVRHTHTVITRLGALLTAATDAETGQRGYLLTGDESYLAPYRQAVASVPARIRQLRALVADNPAQQRRVDALAALLTERLTLAGAIGELRRREGPEAAQRELLKGRGKELHDLLRQQVAGLRETEEALLAEREDRAHRSAVVTQTVILGGGVLAFGLLGLATLALRRDFAGRERAEAALREANAGLETRVAARTAQLAQANAALAASERRFRALIEHSGDSIALVDADNRILYLSPSVAAVEGHAPEELVGRNGLERTHPDDLPLVQAIVAQLMANPGRPVPVLWRRRHKDGRWLWLEGTATNLLHDPAVGAIVTNYRDVTGRKLAEEELRRSREEFRDLFEHAPVGYHEVDASGRIIRINQAELSMLGRTAEELVGQPVWTISADEELSHQTVQAKLAGQRTPGEFERRLRRKDGTTFPALIGDRLVFQADGTVTGIRAVVQDITERRRIEEEIRALNVGLERRIAERTAQLAAINADLRRSQAVFENLFVSLPGLFLVLTPDLRIVDASDAYLKATMTTREGIIGRGLFEVFPDNPADPAADGVRNLRASLERVGQTLAPDTMPIQKYDVRRSDGTFEERHWSPINSPVFGADRRIEYIVHRVEDVTDFVRHKARLPGADPQSLRVRIEQMEAEVFRSAQALLASNQQLAAANRELESFAYSVSHDLRAPLRGIAGFAQALGREQGGRLDDTGRQYLARVLAAAERMGQLIDDLLELSRVTRAELVRQPVNLSALARSVADGLRQAEPARTVQVVIAEGMTGEGDARLLRIVLENLLGNAWKFTARARAARIEFGPAPDGAGRASFAVRDNGAGFDMRYADKLFGPFQRLHGQGEFPGTGIGLATVQRIILRHGGRVWAEAVPGAGATFHFSL